MFHVDIGSNAGYMLLASYTNIASGVYMFISMSSNLLNGCKDPVENW